MILHGLKPPMPTYPGVQAVLGRNDAQFHITGWHVAGAVDQIYDALEEHPPEKPMGVSHEIRERPETKTPGNQSRGDMMGYMIYLVGGIPTPLKNMKVSWDYSSQYIWNNKKCSKPPTSLL